MRKRINFVKNGNKWNAELYVTEKGHQEICLRWVPMGSKRECEKQAKRQPKDVVITWSK